MITTDDISIRSDPSEPANLQERSCPAVEDTSLTAAEILSSQAGTGEELPRPAALFIP